MFSSFSSFLPSGLTSNNNNHHPAKEPITPRPGANGHPSGGLEEVAAKPASDEDDKGGKKAKRERPVNENFIVVRPPPSKTNHPLNLQLQLVPPAFKDKDRSSSRRSVDLSESGVDAPSESSAGNASLSRSMSLRSTASDRSEGSVYSNATSSVASIASTASSSSGRRMIIPLYNLSAHNVMTNTVLDAGTDAKVAKFGKRGVEIVGLAFLEPTEVFGGPGYVVVTADDVKRVSGTEERRSLEYNGSPISSAVSLSSASDINAHGVPFQASPIKTTPTVTIQPPQGGTRKLFGKMFKKRDAERSASISSLSEIVKPTPAVYVQAPTEPKPTAADLNAVLQPAVLGVQPTLSCITYPPTGRPTHYAWVVKKWIKGSPEGLLNKLNIGGEQSRAGLQAVEVRFEWIRGKSSASVGHRRERISKTEKGSRRNSTALTVSSAPSETSLNDSEATPSAPQLSLKVPRNKAAKRLSVESSRSPARSVKRWSFNPPPKLDDESDHTTSHADHGDSDDGDESDPEDSETPWTCQLTMRRLPGPHHAPHFRATSHSQGPARANSVSTPASMHLKTASSPHQRRPTTAHSTADEIGGVGAAVQTTQDEPPISVKLGTLRPAPHHPKVVVQLKVPYPLPDIEIEQMRVQKRVLTSEGIARPTTATGAGQNRAGEQLVMTAEDLKDVLCTTAFWLIVREGLGGVGRVNRKGDGWRIRG